MGFSTLLVANRGEIAVRILRTAKARGYHTVAVFTEVDADALHVEVADEALALPPGGYLDAQAVIEAARRSGAEAIHPGYGFLSENPSFARAVEAEGLVFVGPPARAIELMGDKRQAKLRMEEAGVPCIPGYSGSAQDLETLMLEAERIGYPLMVKASAGGGGRGLRRVESDVDLRSQLELARSEAESGFGDGTLILERAIDGARHVEVQVFADQHGHAVHLFERDCSVQRRHQKVVEEAPSPAVAPELRSIMGEAAVKAARAVDYVGAGTVEMLLDPSGAFYFMEMNTRLQVEHPVTEMVTGLDLVALQLDVAEGRPLPFSQEDLHIDGHAIEFRLYAEDPSLRFLPQVGTILRWEAAEGEGVRVDHGLKPGQRVGSDYDPMLAKLIAHGRDREEARRRLLRALERTELLGLTCNQAFGLEILQHPSFVDGETDTGFIARHLPAPSAPEPEPEDLAVALALLGTDEAGAAWSSTGATARVVNLDPQGSWRVRGGATLEFEGPRELPSVGGLRRAGAHVHACVGGRRTSWSWHPTANGLELFRRGRRFVFHREDPSHRVRAEASSGELRAPMAGKVVEVRVASGAEVEAGAAIVVLEAMKMQLEVAAPRAGMVELSVEIGTQVAHNAVLARVAPRGEQT